MGAELDTDLNPDAMTTGNSDWLSIASSEVALLALHSRLPWLDLGTAELLVEIANDLWLAQPEVVAVILFGSLARHEERPLGASRPSDVDLLVLVRAVPGSTGARISLDHKLSVYHTIGEREYRHPSPSLEVQAILADETLSGWDNQFIENVARDGVLLWSRICLPDMLAQIADRGAILFPPNPSMDGR